MLRMQSKADKAEESQVLTAFLGLCARLNDSLENTLEIQKNNLVLWSPIFLAFGISGYFSLPLEPPLNLILITFGLLISTATIIFSRIHDTAIGVTQKLVLLALILMAIGFLAATIRTHNMYTPMLTKKLGPVDIIGTISDIEYMEEGDGIRLTLTNLNIERLGHSETPTKVRLRLRQGEGIQIGQKIEALALLNPPSSPFIPDGFDFRRYMYFKEIGAVGFIYSAPEILEQPKPRTLWIEKIRESIAHKILDSLPSRQASIALALTVGQKKAITEDDREAIRSAGLAHMLAISGLHVGMLATCLFFFVRLCLSLIPNFALLFPTKKIAAVCAFAGAVFYMMIAGSTIPTQRAVLMAGVAFLAILLDRSPISLRLVAFAAFITLLFSPESILSASFQMSFAAVTCLIYFYELTRKFWIDQYAKQHIGNKIMLYFIGVCITTIIASIATAPFALYHFGQVSYLGSVANLVAVPILAFMIMPFLLLGVALMPLSLEFYPLKIVEIGIDQIIQISYWAASLPHAMVRTTAMPYSAFILIIAATLFLMLWKGKGKIAGLPLYLAAAIVLLNHQLPNVLVSSSHKLFAFTETGKELYVSSRNKDRFVLSNWQEHYGLNEDKVLRLPNRGKNAQESGDYLCGESGCRLTLNEYKVSYIRHAYDLKEECAWADILISVEPLPKSLNRKNKCKSRIIIDKFDTYKNGAQAIWLTPDGIKHEHVAYKSSHRPWSEYQNKSLKKQKRWINDTYAKD